MIELASRTHRTIMRKSLINGAIRVHPRASVAQANLD
jgi:hypothetical protein